MADPTCSIAGCDRDVKARGICKRHYYRWARYGDPEYVRPQRPALDVFMEKIDKADSGCWLWTGPHDKTGGYGKFCYGGVKDGAHRWGYRLLVGPIPAGLDLDHLCRVRLCVNPDHLEPVTRRENLLRGDTLPAAQVKRTHCPRNHEYTEANTYINRGMRHCRTCLRESNRVRYANRART